MAPHTDYERIVQSIRYKIYIPFAMLIDAQCCCTEDAKSLILTAACSCRIRELTPELLEKD